MVVDASVLAPQFEEYAEVFKSNQIAEYLASQEWACLADKPFGQLWAKSSMPSSELASVILPKVDAGDYASRLNEALAALTRILSRSVPELAEAVASVRADLFFIRVDQAMADGTIPLRQAAQLLESIDRMVKSAAVATANPASTGSGRVSTAVKHFLDEDVRMGHTKRGSFIITVAARHEDIPSDNPSAVPKPSAGDDPTEVETFSRRVMTTLSRSLTATKRHVARGDDFVSLDEAVLAGVRAPLVDALADLGGGEGLRSIDLSFKWSERLPEPDVEDETVVFRKEEFAKLENVSARLKREYVPQEETLVGQVTELRRPDIPDPNDDGGEVVMRADFEGRIRNVRLNLTSRMYEIALAAHKERIPLVAKGTVEKKGRSWQLSGDISVSKLDLSSL